MPKPLTGMTDLESRAWVCLVSLSQLLTPALDARLRPNGVTTFELGVLVTLAEAKGGGVRISEIAAMLHATLPHTSKVISKLEARGLVEREISPTDARASSIALSRAGWRIIIAAVPVYSDEARSLILSKLGSGQIETLVDILEPLVLQLDPNGAVARP
ncbi:MarR family winged helix-turn-helix transcriptional regulator [Arthrobacter sp. SA17]